MLLSSILHHTYRISGCVFNISPYLITLSPISIQVTVPHPHVHDPRPRRILSSRTRCSCMARFVTDENGAMTKQPGLLGRALRYVGTLRR